MHERVLIAPYKGRRYIKDDVTGYPRRWNERAIADPRPSQGVEAIPHLVELKLNDPFDVNVLGEIAVRVCKLLTLGSRHHQVVRQSIDAISFIQADAEPFLEKFMRLMTTDCDDWQRKEVERGWVAHDQVRLNIASVPPRNDLKSCLSLVSMIKDMLRLPWRVDIEAVESGASLMQQRELGIQVCWGAQKPLISFCKNPRRSRVRVAPQNSISLKLFAR